MKAMEYAQMMKEAREESAALEDSQLLVGEALRSLEAYSSHRDFFEKVIAIVERNCQTGSYKRTVTLENGKAATHRFSWAVAMMHGGTMGKYKNQFDASVPEWVLRRHPYQIHLLCSLAIESGIRLPELLFGYFSPPEAEKLRALRSEANCMLVGEIRKVYNREWLESLREQFTHARQVQSSL
jgi:hypothetical protein